MTERIEMLNNGARAGVYSRNGGPIHHLKVRARQALDTLAPLFSLLPGARARPIQSSRPADPLLKSRGAAARRKRLFFSDFLRAASAIQSLRVLRSAFFFWSFFPPSACCTYLLLPRAQLSLSPAARAGPPV